jgi:hypothetical protein
VDLIRVLADSGAIFTSAKAKEELTAKAAAARANFFIISLHSEYQVKKSVAHSENPEKRFQIADMSNPDPATKKSAFRDVLLKVGAC